MRCCRSGLVQLLALCCVRSDAGVNDATLSLSQWLQKQPGGSVDGIVVRTGGRGRGLFATRPIAAGEALVAVPLQLVLPAARVYDALRIHDFEANDDLTQWVAAHEDDRLCLLALVLLLEIAPAGTSSVDGADTNGDANAAAATAPGEHTPSPWHAYLNALPRLGTFLLPSAELGATRLAAEAGTSDSHNTTLQQKRASERQAECLRGTEAHNLLLASTEALTSAFAWLAAIAPPTLGHRLGLHSSRVGVGGIQSTQGLNGAARWAWAWSLAQSRAFNLRNFARTDSTTGSVSLDSATMVPLIDMANHAEQPGAATATVVVEKGTVVLRAIRGIEQGGEVTISYGHGRGYQRSYGHSDISAAGEGWLERPSPSPGTLAMPSADSFINYGFVSDEAWNIADSVLLRIATDESSKVDQLSEPDGVNRDDVSLWEHSEYELYFGDGTSDAWLVLGHGAIADMRLREAVRRHGGDHVRSAILSRLSRYTIRCKEHTGQLHVEQPCGCSTSHWGNCKAAHKVACNEQRLLRQALRQCDQLTHEEVNAEL